MGDIPEGTPKFTPFYIHEVTPEEKERYRDSPSHSILKTPTAIFSVGADAQHRSSKRLTFSDTPNALTKRGSRESSSSSTASLRNGDAEPSENAVQIALSPTKSIRVSPDSWKAHKAYQRFDDYSNETIKTDYSYSHLSPYYNREIIPGMTMRPNMSRPALRASEGCVNTTPVNSRLKTRTVYSVPLLKSVSQRFNSLPKRSISLRDVKASHFWLWTCFLLLLLGFFSWYPIHIPTLESRKIEDTKFSFKQLHDLTQRLEGLNSALENEVMERQENIKLLWSALRKSRKMFQLNQHYRCRMQSQKIFLSNFINYQNGEENLENKLSHIRAHMTTESNKLRRNVTLALDNIREDIRGGHVEAFNIHQIVNERLKLYDADKTALPDFAMESAGGTVIGVRCTQPWPTPQHFESFDPLAALRPGVAPGECWAFQGTGHLMLRLSYPAYVTGCSVEHIPESIHPFGRIASAPKDFILLGLREENDTSPHYFGNFQYNIGGNATTVQYFPVLNFSSELFSIVELIITSNHGYQYTCLYRIRIHGTLK